MFASDSATLLLQSSLLARLPGLSHGFTTRLGGVSEGPFHSLNLKYPVSASDETGGDDKVYENRRRVCLHLGLKAEDLVACQQVHGQQIGVVSTAERGRGAFSQQDALPETDGLITDVAALPLLVMVADCYPVLLADPVRRAVGAVHSGWRGTQQNIAVAALEKMQAQYGSRPEDVRVAIGPGIGFAHFEVGPEVIAAFADQIDLGDPQVVASSGTRYRLNLPEILRRQLLKAGIQPEHLDVVAGCTVAEAERFYSFRREQGRTGRQAGIIAWQTDN
ncbi:MAG: peptidoglycan editing factor PgeF [Candidatus Sericytochromatia bacterium]